MFTFCPIRNCLRRFLCLSRFRLLCVRVEAAEAAEAAVVVGSLDGGRGGSCGRGCVGGEVSGRGGEAAVDGEAAVEAVVAAAGIVGGSHMFSTF